MQFPIFLMPSHQGTHFNINFAGIDIVQVAATKSDCSVSGASCFSLVQAYCAAATLRIPCCTDGVICWWVVLCLCFVHYCLYYSNIFRLSFHNSHRVKLMFHLQSALWAAVFIDCANFNCVGQINREQKKQRKTKLIFRQKFSHQQSHSQILFTLCAEISCVQATKMGIIIRIIVGI